MRTTGTYLQVPSPGEPYRAFVPAPLPPAPPLEFTAADHDLVERASRALGRLDGLTALLPDTSLFIYAYVRKEAVVSSQIEGTQSSFADLLLYESDQAPGVPLEDVREVSDYVAALQHGLEQMKGGFPLSLRLIREIVPRGTSAAPSSRIRRLRWDEPEGLADGVTRGREGRFG